MKLTVNLRDIDGARLSRLLLAWLDGDKLACDVVLAETMEDPIGAPSLLFALTEFAASTGEQVAPDIREQLRAGLLTQGGV